MFKFHDFTGVGSRRAGVLSTTAAPIPVLMFTLALTLVSTAALAATPARKPCGAVTQDSISRNKSDKKITLLLLENTRL